MTKEEALKELNELREYCEDTFLKRTQIPYINALDMAIEALKVEPCEDAISRSDMLDAIGHGTTYTSEELQRIIQTLSPVNPQPNTGHWIHTDECDEEWQYRCSKCNMPSRSNAHRYCSNCGSYMYGVEPQESEEV